MNWFTIFVVQIYYFFLQIHGIVVNSIDAVGYPDYVEYDMNNSKVVQSWWEFRLTRKSDKKKLIIPAMYLHDFNDEGKIIRS